MSADNRIYVLQTKDGFRVAHLQAVENMWWNPKCCDKPDIEAVFCDISYPEGAYHEKCRNCGAIDPEFEETDYVNWNTLYNWFHESRIYPDKESAMQRADEIYREIMDDSICPIVEYGIQFINGLETFDFPKKETKNGN